MEEDRGLSPSISQVWDFETLYDASQPNLLEDLAEEDEQPGIKSCWSRCGSNMKGVCTAIGASLHKWSSPLPASVAFVGFMTCFTLSRI